MKEAFFVYAYLRSKHEQQRGFPSFLSFSISIRRPLRPKFEKDDPIVFTVTQKPLPIAAYL